MPYRKVTDFDKLPPLPLSEDTAKAFAQIIERSVDGHISGIAGWLGALPPAEHFERVVQNEALGVTPPPDSSLEEQMLHAIFGRQDTDGINAQETGISQETAQQVLDLTLLVQDLMLARTKPNFDLATKTQREAFLLSADLIEDSFDPIGMLPGAKALNDINTAMAHISADPQVPDRLQRICEALYTMATADIPLSYEQALARVSKTTLVPPQRKGVDDRQA